ncbi:hypothetical protein NDU88_005306 [Pleurodeles waltl]|uniref:Uncharacterized protein n=1 Tax=Pleurodeles waltl TaxID=8319 RepID=A0AAV7UHN1_PLEWA|nr:hypothetical protein NDU88_005306 [Pleurodeles waltl]
MACRPAAQPPSAHADVHESGVQGVMACQSARTKRRLHSRPGPSYGAATLHEALDCLTRCKGTRGLLSRRPRLVSVLLGLEPAHYRSALSWEACGGLGRGLDGPAPQRSRYYEALECGPSLRLR